MITCSEGISAQVSKVLAVDIDTDNGLTGIRYARDVQSLEKLVRSAENDEPITWLVFFSWGFTVFIDQIPSASFELQSNVSERITIALAKMQWLNDLLDRADSEGCKQLQVDIAYGIKTVPRMELVD